MSKQRPLTQDPLFPQQRAASTASVHHVEGSGRAQDSLGRRMEFSYYSQSPYPDPVILKAYEDQIPGAAKLLLEQAIKQSDHRMDLEKRVVREGNVRSWGGLISAFVLSVLSIILSFELIQSGHDWAGASITTATIVGLAGTFIYGTRSQRKERSKKAELMTQAIAPRPLDSAE